MLSHICLNLGRQCFNALPVVNNGRRGKSTGTKDQLLIDKMVLADCKRKHKNLAKHESMRYGASLLDYRKLKNGTCSEKYIDVSAETRSKLKDRTDILWRHTWFSYILDEVAFKGTVCPPLSLLFEWYL